MRSIILAAVFFTVSAGFAAAQNCDDPQTQSEMNACAGQMLEEADAALNATYAEVRERLQYDEEGRDLLVKAQRAWIAYRDAECEMRSMGVAGGSIYPTIHAGCLTDLTEQRTADFNAMLQCPEGDLSCPF